MRLTTLSVTGWSAGWLVPEPWSAARGGVARAHTARAAGQQSERHGAGRAPRRRWSATCGPRGSIGTSSSPSAWWVDRAVGHTSAGASASRSHAAVFRGQSTLLERVAGEQDLTVRQAGRPARTRGSRRTPRRRARRRARGGARRASAGPLRAGRAPHRAAGACDGRAGGSSPRRPSCDSTVSLAHSCGCGSQVSTPCGEKPNGGVCPDHGSGTRQPSRPGSRPPERWNIGSWRSSSGRSSTSAQAELVALVHVQRSRAAPAISSDGRAGPPQPQYLGRPGRRTAWPRRRTRCPRRP